MTRELLLLCTLMILPVLASGLQAAGRKAQTPEFESFWKSPSSVELPVTMDAGKASVSFPAIPKKSGMVAVARFKAFLKTPTHGGWSQYLKLDLNGKALGADVEESRFRVLNRTRSIKSEIGDQPCYTGNAILTMFGPGGDECEPRILSDRDEGYWYLLDISDYANYSVIGVDNRLESEGPNTLNIENFYVLHSTGETSTCKEFVLENLEIGYLPESVVKKLRGTTSMQMAAVTGPSISVGNAVITAGKNGLLQIKVNGESYFINSMFSYPGKDNINYNRMGWPGTSDAGWKVSSVLNKNKQLVIRGDWKDYSITRTIRVDNGKFRVTDNITNKTDKPLGMRLRNNILTNNDFTSSNVFLNGSNSMVGTDNCAANPSYFINQRKSSAAVLVEDNVLRLQMDVTKKDNRVEFGTEHFGLAPKKSYIMEWTIYTSKSTDYWDFVNRVRNDLKLNNTMYGPFVFVYDQDIPERKAQLHCMAPFFLYANGGHLDKDQYAELVKPRVKALLARQPDAIPLGMIETNLVTLDRNKLGGGNTITRDKIYGLELDEEHTKLLANDPLYSPWFDSEIKTGDGRAIIDTYYAYKPNLMNMMVYPVIGNHQYEYMLWQIDFLMDQCGMKGIYMDQFNLGIKLEQAGRSDYSKWDGHTVDLKSNGEIARMYTDCTLAGSTARAAIVKHIISKGGLVVTNGHPVAKETNGLPIHAFAETEWDVSNGEELLSWGEPLYIPAIGEAHLSSPLSLGIRPNRFGDFGKEHWAEIIHKWVITCLKNGTLYCYYESVIPKEGPGSGDYGITNYMYPFTPVELHSGYLIGKERILTAKSGSFFWNHPDKPVVLAFNLKGYQIQPKKADMTRKGKGWQVVIGINDWQETAVIKNANEK